MERKDRYRVGIFRVRMGRGGSEARTMWAMEALKKDFDVTLVTSGEVDLNSLNAFYGTSIHPSEIKLRKAPIPNVMTRNAHFAFWRGALYQRFCRRIAPAFDILISTYNLCDFGVPAIHYLADFSWDDHLRKQFDFLPSDYQATVYKNRLARDMYRIVGKILSNPSGRDLFGGKDLIVANSRWSARIVAQKYGIETDVVYPPVSDRFPQVDDKNKEYGFVYIGRIYPEKQIEKMVSILKKVRKKGHDIHFHLIGNMHQSRYGQDMEQLCHSEKDWVQLDGELFGKKKLKILSQHRFGIHARNKEPFGISIAEMVNAGCIPFIPAGGGQREIVNHPALMFTSEMDAVDKIHAVLSNEALQNDVLAHLKLQRKIFSTHHFTSGFLNILDKYLKINKIGTHAN